MKKIEIPRFMSFGFVNKDLSSIKTVKGLTKSFTRVLEISDRDPFSIRLMGEIYEEEEDLRRLQKLMIQFVELSIKRFQRSNSIDKEYDKIKGVISDESSKFKLFGDSRWSYREAILESKGNIVKDLVIPGLCYDFMEFKKYSDRHGYWGRIKKCLECHRFFIRKTDRYALYCSKMCRDRNRQRKKVKSGEWAKYMKEWRARKK
jgi:hypothetical protein